MIVDLVVKYGVNIWKMENDCGSCCEILSEHVKNCFTAEVS